MVTAVPNCQRRVEAKGSSLEIIAVLEDDEACEDGTLTLRVQWTAGRRETLEVEGMGYPSDLWVVDLSENGSEDIVVGHEDGSGSPPRIRAFESTGTALRKFRLSELGREDLFDYAGGGNFYTRGGRLFFAYPLQGGGSRTLIYAERGGTWSEIDPLTFETDRPRTRVPEIP
ncbi:MAG: hypothetical protein R3E10_11160 [Gemmatimonadota bacterium]